MANPKGALRHLVWLMKGLRVYALVGKSGTGKSFRAQLVAEKFGIDLILDDGLLIRGGKILAGKSAKREKGLVDALKTALFSDAEQTRKVQEVLHNEQFKRVLILGTSIRMVRRIATRLDLPQPHRIIPIEDVATQEEIEHASRTRRVEGKHIIPVPSIEIKRNYPHIFFDSIRIFLRKRFNISGKEKVYEKTVVRPVFSRGGRISISETALTQMVMHCIQEFDPELKVEKIVVSEDGYQYRLEVILEIPYGKRVAETFLQLQDYIRKHIEEYTGLQLKEVNITIGNVSGKSR
jgi:adenylate kinase family enzyme